MPFLYSDGGLSRALAKQLPDEFSIDDLVERLVVLHKIEKGLDQADEGQTLSGAKAREQLQRIIA